jgi:diguanylate cyclase (GGDEF)-like protein/PAS domain S-box-containing protein
MSQVRVGAGDGIAQREPAEHALARAVAANSAIQRASLDGILLVDADQKILSFNPQFAGMWKVPDGLAAGASDASVLGAVAAQVADPAGFAARVRDLYANTDETSRDEVKLRDGRTLDRYSAPVKLDDGTYLGRVWFFRDITAHKLADDTIREDASRFRALVEQQIAGIFIIRGDGTLAYINGRFSALFGYTPAEVIGLPFIDLIVEKDRNTLRQAFAEHLLGGPLATQSVTALKRKDGGIMNVLAHASLAAYQGKPALVGIVVDITEGKRSMDLLQASEERFRLLVEQAPDAILLYDADADRFVSANASAVALFGCSREELIASGPLRFLIDDATGRPPDDSIAEHHRQALAGVECAFERRLRNAQGREVICDVRLVRLPTITGRLLRASLVDVTERRRTEAALAYRDRVRHAVNLALAGLMTAPSLAAGMPAALQTAAQALAVDRIVVLRKSPLQGPAIAVSLAYSWQAADVPVLDASTLSSIAPDSPELAGWLTPLFEGKHVITDAAAAPGAIGLLMRSLHNKSSLLVPIAVSGKFWGQIGVDDCKAARRWTAVEIDSLGTLSQGIGSLVARERSEDALKSSEERFRAVCDTARDAIVMVDPAGSVTYWNRAAERILGYTRSEALGKGVHQWLAAPHYRAKALAAMHAFSTTGSGAILGQTVEMSALRKDGVEIPIEVSVAAMLLGVEWHAVATVRDITERRRILEQIRFSAQHDNLTGLANRTVFVEALQQAIHRAQRDGEKFAVLYLDLDHFKDVNDTLGHPVGDLLLQALADRLRSSIRGMDTVARFGGDEFALIQTSIPEPLDAAVLAEKLLQAISEPFPIKGDEIRTGASIGIAMYGLDSPTAETLLSHADVALYRAKAEGRGTYRFFTDAMDVEVHTRVTLAAELRDALAAGEIFLMYQPQIDVDTGRFGGVEALARWRHPKTGLVPPSIFIPIAEQSGLIVALGNWVLREASRQMQEWIDAGIAPPLMAVNVSGLQFKTPFALENEIAAISAATGLPPQRLELELTESVLMEVSGAHNDELLRLRKTGHRIAIDDFGTGYSSLEYLGRFPVDRIKIAQSFIIGLTATSANSVIIKAAIGIAQQLKLEVVVEGVETAAQLELVRSWGGRMVQGYYFSAPLLARDLSPLLRAGRMSPAPPAPPAPSATAATTAAAAAVPVE